MSQIYAGEALKEVRNFLQTLESKKNLLSKQISNMSSIGDEREAQKALFDDIKSMKESAMSVVSSAKLVELQSLTAQSPNAQKYLKKVIQFNNDYYIHLEQGFKEGRHNLEQLEKELQNTIEAQEKIKTQIYPEHINISGELTQSIAEKEQMVAQLAPNAKVGATEWVGVMDKLLALESLSSISLKETVENKSKITHFWRRNFGANPATYKKQQEVIVLTAQQFNMTASELVSFSEEYKNQIQAEVRKIRADVGQLNLRLNISTQTLSDVQMQMSVMDKKMRELPVLIASEKIELSQELIALEKYKSLSDQQRFERSFSSLMTQDFYNAHDSDGQIKQLMDFLLCLTQNEQTQKQLIDFVTKRAAREKISGVVEQSLMAQTQLLKALQNFITSLKKSESKLKGISSYTKVKLDIKKIEKSVDTISNQADKIITSVDKVRVSVLPAYETNFSNFTLPMSLGLGLGSYELINAHSQQLFDPQSELMEEYKKRQNGDDGSSIDTFSSGSGILDTLMITDLLDGIESLSSNTLEVNTSMQEIESSVTAFESVSSPASSCSTPSSSCSTGSSCGGGGGGD